MVDFILEEYDINVLEDTISRILKSERISHENFDLNVPNIKYKVAPETGPNSFMKSSLYNYSSENMSS